ncbi:MAG: hypothetical protein ACD_19C00187G0017 [uncultured bacterium]|nr:MAG: hypothetical protein ACD_19C00187G0017 [uncultured bacterium]
MYSNEPTNTKLDDYISGESQRQFSDAKREEVEATKVGRAKYSIGLLEKLEGTEFVSPDKLEKLAKLKGQTVLICSICNRGFLARSSRGNTFPLCITHINQKGMGQRVKKGLGFEDRKVNTMEYLKKTRTTQTGPFFNPKAPTK